jgi:hypothetical protein
MIAALAQAALAMALVVNPLVERHTWDPPARFDHAFHGKLDVTRLPQYRVPLACQALLKPLGIPAHSNQRGCSIGNASECHVIIIDRPYHGTLPRDVLRHEIGHCNGWPANHPA